MKLPIDVVPGTDPPVFRWSYMGQDHEGQAPPAMERAVERVVTIAKQLLADNAALRGQVDGMTERLASQTEQLSRRAEAAPEVVSSKGATERRKR